MLVYRSCIRTTTVKFIIQKALFLSQLTSVLLMHNYYEVFYHVYMPLTGLAIICPSLDIS